MRRGLIPPRTARDRRDTLETSRLHSGHQAIAGFAFGAGSFFISTAVRRCRVSLDCLMGAGICSSPSDAGLVSESTFGVVIEYPSRIIGLVRMLSSREDPALGPRGGRPPFLLALICHGWFHLVQFRPNSYTVSSEECRTS